MTKYHVHLYREMRLYYPGIEAASHEEAARIASQKSVLEAEGCEDCDGEDIAALVDVEGDTEYEQSRVIDFDPARAAAHNLLDSLEKACVLLDRIRETCEYEAGLPVTFLESRDIEIIHGDAVTELPAIRAAIAKARAA